MLEQRKSTQDLFNELTERLEIPLKDNEILCPTCKGLRFIYEQQEDEGHIKNCNDCYNGKLHVCKHCGKTSKTNHCNCEKSQQERQYNWRMELQKNEQELFKKAKKIKFKDYEGNFILGDGDPIKDSDDVYKWLYNKIEEDVSEEELPKYLWGTKSEPVFSLDLDDVIQNKCEDGYEDMYNCLDTNDEDLEKSQEYLDKWYQKQGDSINIYYEDSSIAVTLDDLIKEIKENIKKESVNNGK